MAKNNLAVLAGADPAPPVEFDGLTALVAYGAALWVMITADQTVLPEERELLTLTVPYPDDLRLGQDFLQEYGLDGLLARLPQVLTPPQRLCVYANLLAVAMVDGALRVVEQDLLERFRDALALSESEAAQIYAVLLLKNSLGVFQSVNPT